MSKNYSEKVNKLLERFDNHSLKILLEEDEESNSDDSSKDEENTDVSDDSDDKESSDNTSFEFPSNNDTEEELSDDIEGVLDNEGETAGDQADGVKKKGPDTKTLEMHLDNAVRDFQNQLDMSTDSAGVVLTVDDQANSFLDSQSTSSYKDDYYEDDYYEDDSKSTSS